jgi:tyrosyl-tRNA synthetase
MLVLRRFLEDGHKVILLIGGGTGMIGDPSGKSEERNLLDDATIDRNATAIAAQGSKIFNGMEFSLMNNAEWLRGLNYIEFLRDIGKHFSVNAMLQRDSVKDRLENQEQGISYTEFSYMLLQSYDYLHLHTHHGCDVQIGASDQWGNILSGVDLIRRKTGDTVYAFTSPLLINKATGKKFGKSEQGAVWLDPAKTSPYQFYQFFLNVDDDAVEELLLKMTLLPKEEIATNIGTKCFTVETEFWKKYIK